MLPSVPLQYERQRQRQRQCQCRPPTQAQKIGRSPFHDLVSPSGRRSAPLDRTNLDPVSSLTPSRCTSLLSLAHSCRLASRL